MARVRVLIADRSRAPRALHGPGLGSTSRDSNESWWGRGSSITPKHALGDLAIQVRNRLVSRRERRRETAPSRALGLFGGANGVPITALERLTRSTPYPNHVQVARTPRRGAALRHGRRRVGHGAQRRRGAGAQRAMMAPRARCQPRRRQLIEAPPPTSRAWRRGVVRESYWQRRHARAGSPRGFTRCGAERAARG